MTQMTMIVAAPIAIGVICVHHKNQRHQRSIHRKLLMKLQITIVEPSGLEPLSKQGTKMLSTRLAAI